MKRILVVEDNRRIREGLLTLVERAGFRVTGARDFDAAAELLRSERFDLLITDLDLPGGTGLDLIRHAKASCPRMASILVTANGCTEVRKQTEELELAGYFEKPYDPVALLRLVRSSIDEKSKLSARSARSG